MAKYSLLRHKTSGERVVRINKTRELVKEFEQPERFKELAKRARNNARQSQRNELLRSFGLTKTPYGWE